MQHRSLDRRRWGNYPAGKRSLGERKVDEFNQQSKGASLPERARKRAHKMVPKGKKHPGIVTGLAQALM